MKAGALANRFRKQEAFAKDYSPLYALFFGTMATWLEQGDGNPAENDPLVAWLLAAANGRTPFDIPLLLAAGLHRDVLMGVDAVAPLAAFYASVGGVVPQTVTGFAPALRQAIWSRRHGLASFIQTATVQTNETGRGMAWLLPLLFTGWTAVHLVDLGCSAGLNLVAEERAYRLVAADGRPLLTIGGGKPNQFQTICQGYHDALPTSISLPRVASRTGCDLVPFVLETAVDEQTLASFIWGDQTHRLQRLREGMAALQKVNAGPTPVHLHAVNLPHELPQFLATHVPTEPAYPIVLYNTYMTIYLENHGAALRDYINEWALKQTTPVLWLQWEPLWNGPQPPEFGWCAWTADLWQHRTHQQFQLAWVQPHGTHLQWLPGLSDWGDVWH